MKLQMKLPRWLSIKALVQPFVGLPESIRAPMLRMSVVFGALLSLGAWQWHFVLNAMNSNIFLNFSIWATFLFGVVLTYRNLLRMKNEDIALKALKEMYEDSRNLSRGSINDPMWRHYRCNDLAVVYERPEVLGHVYQLVSEELASGRDVHVSAGTMQTLVDSVQMRLDERKSLTQYISGILILLGLIGTFIGLMETLASVGKILSDLDVRGSDPTGAIALLLANLQIPLRGMAVGFSSSLFGAVGSLILSLMVRFSAMAFSNFMQDFEEWMANIVQIDDEAENRVSTAGVPASTLMEGRHLELVLRAARISVSSNARLNAQLDTLSGALVELTPRHHRPDPCGPGADGGHHRAAGAEPGRLARHGPQPRNDARRHRQSRRQARIHRGHGHAGPPVAGPGQFPVAEPQDARRNSQCPAPARSRGRGAPPRRNPTKPSACSNSSRPACSPASWAASATSCGTTPTRRPTCRQPISARPWQGDRKMMQEQQATIDTATLARRLKQDEQKNAHKRRFERHAAFIVAQMIIMNTSQRFDGVINELSLGGMRFPPRLALLAAPRDGNGDDRSWRQELFRPHPRLAPRWLWHRAARWPQRRRVARPAQPQRLRLRLKSSGKAFCEKMPPPSAPATSSCAWPR